MVLGSGISRCCIGLQFQGVKVIIKMLFRLRGVHKNYFNFTKIVLV